MPEEGTTAPAAKDEECKAVDGISSNNTSKPLSDDTCDSDETIVSPEESLAGPKTDPTRNPDDETNSSHFLNQLIKIFWMLHKARPINPFLSPIYQPGLTHVESTVEALIEVLHGYAVSCSAAVPLATRLCCTLLLSSDHQVSFSAKSALVRLLRPRTKKQKRVFLPTPPRCSTPGENKSGSKATTSSGVAGGSSSEGAGSSGSGGGASGGPLGAASAALRAPRLHAGKCNGVVYS